MLTSHIAKTHGDEISDRQLQDHVRKLFWALWGPSFGRDVITKAQIEEMQKMAHLIHERRLEGLYVDAREEVLPSEKVKKEEAEKLYKLAEARMGIEENTQYQKILSETTQKDLAWFLEASKNNEKRRAIFGKKSMEKLAELGKVSDWIHWAREQFEQAESEGRVIIDRERKKPEPQGAEANDDKWKIRVRFYTNSHSIRPKPLSWWNSTISWIKLHRVTNDNSQLIADFILPKTIHLDALWWAGWGTARRFMAALNMGSRGFFWWYVPLQIDRYYETIEDLENDSGVKIERKPALKLDWKGGALSEQHLHSTALCFGYLPGPDDRDKHKPFDHYLTGLGFLSKTDVHMQFEANAFEGFYRAMSTGMRQYGDWSDQKPFPDSFRRWLGTHFKSEEFKNKFTSLGGCFETFPPKPATITLEEVGTMKVLCDYYFLQTFNRLALERETKDKGNN